VFLDAGEEIPPYPGFTERKKAYPEITQWQGKEMCNVGHSLSAVLASASRNPESLHYEDFKSALKCVSVLVDITRRAQFRSHTPATLSYMESYLETSHRTKVIVLEFHTTKATGA